MVDVRMPDGTIVRNVPEGTTKAEIMRRYNTALGTADAQVRQIPGMSPSKRQGVSSFLDDELAGIAKATRGLPGLAQAILTGGPVREKWDELVSLYEQGQQAVEREVEQYRAENPPGMVRIRGKLVSSGYPSLGAQGEEILGGAVSGGKVVSTAKTAGGRIGQAVVAGGAQGAVAGAAAAKPGERVKGAIVGGAGGAILGGSITAGAEGARAATELLNSNPAKRALRALGTALDADDVTPEIANARLDSMGGRGMVVDVGGVKTRATFREAATRGLKANRVNTALDRRQAGSSTRIMAAAKRALKSEEGALETIDDLINVRAHDADILYRKAYEQPIKNPENLNVLLRNNHMQRAWRKAEDLINVERDTARAAYTRALEAGDDVTIQNADQVLRLPKLLIKGEDGATRINPEAVRTTQVWDYVKRALDDEINAAMTPDVVGRLKDTNTSRLLRNMKNEMLNEIDVQNSTFKLARSTFAGETESIEAVEMGRQFLRGDRNMTIKEINALSPQDKELFRIGAADAIRSKIEDVDLTSSAAKKIFGSPDKQSRLAAAFPDQKSYREFQKTVLAEMRMARTRRIVPAEAGSQTELRHGGAASQLAGAGVDAVTGNKIGLLRRLLSVDSKMDPKVADAILVMAGRPDKAKDTLSAISQLKARDGITAETAVAIERILTSGGIAAGAPAIP